MTALQRIAVLAKFPRTVVRWAFGNWLWSVATGPTGILAAAASAAGLKAEGRGDGYAAVIALAVGIVVWFAALAAARWWVQRQERRRAAGIMLPREVRKEVRTLVRRGRKLRKRRVALEGQGKTIMGRHAIEANADAAQDWLADVKHFVNKESRGRSIILIPLTSDAAAMVKYIDDTLLTLTTIRNDYGTMRRFKIARNS